MLVLLRQRPIDWVFDLQGPWPVGLGFIVTAARAETSSRQKNLERNDKQLNLKKSSYRAKNPAGGNE